MNIKELKNYIAIVKDWPTKGVVFKDITPLMSDGKAYQFAIDQIINYAKNLHVDIVVGPEARGFIIGCPVSYALGIGFVPVRKSNKLPRETIAQSYDLEYGKNTLTIHKDAIKPGQRVLITDDLLATGGTIKATIELIEKLGGVVAGCAFLIELKELCGREKLNGYDRLILMDF